MDRKKSTITTLVRIADRVASEAPLLESALRGRLLQLLKPAIEVAIESAGPLPEILLALARKEGTDQVAMRVMVDVPADTDSLAALRQWALERLSNLLKSSTAPSAARNRLDVLAGLAIHYQKLGNAKKAEATAEEALRVADQMQRNRPKKRATEDEILMLAELLYIHGSTLSEFGDDARAAPFLGRAIRLMKPFAAKYPKERRHVADMQVRLAVVLDNLGKPEAAKGERDRAINNLDKYLSSLPPGKFMERVGAASMLGTVFMHADRDTEAASHLRVAVDGYRDLAAVQPGRFGLALATDLSNLGNILGNLGQPAEALPVLEEAATAYAVFARRGQSRLREELAQVHMNLAVVRAELGNIQAAIGATIRALKLRRAGAAKSKTLRHNVVYTLFVLAALHLKANDIEAAMTTLAECQQLTKELLLTNIPIPVRLYLCELKEEIRKLRRKALRHRHSPSQIWV